ncbi:MAG: aldo/keto reductase [Granulosicoccus sp.]
MIKRTIGSLQVSAVGLGCMNVSFGYGSADDDESAALLNTALDAGVTFLDTAFLYGQGHNEMLLGKALSGRRKEFVLASKCGLSMEGINGRPERLKSECEQSLVRLKTDVIDLYYLHRLDPNVPIEESVGALADLVESGKVREIGLSEVCVETLRKAHRVHPIAAVQSEYSLWTRTPERGVLDACDELGIAFVPFSPLGRGFLAGSAAAVNDLQDTDLRCTIARPRFETEAFLHNSMLLEDFSQIAKVQQCTMAQLALAWLLAQQNQTLVPIPGTRQVSHLLENLAASDIKLDSDVEHQLNATINESTVKGTRYTAARMAETDAERDPMDTYP